MTINYNCPPPELEDGIQFDQTSQLQQDSTLKHDRGILRKWASEFSPKPLPLQIDISQIDDIVDRLLPPVFTFAPIPDRSIKFQKPDSADSNGEQNITLDVIEASIKFGIVMGTLAPQHRPYDEKTILGVLDHRILPPLVHDKPKLTESKSVTMWGQWLLRYAFKASILYCQRMVGIERIQQPRWLTRLFLKGLLHHIYGMCSAPSSSFFLSHPSTY
jgi:hypothetical protein